ncbi:S24 family peptidase [Aurantibacter aestuarii]|uniref:Peptidase S24/S26A/S26B/S26C domain-containing protein n=1 Tax=Aurantibacter aestuarii TaxID=1266046 RepID=A0A2T1NBX6_9FLAO|nr:S24 family peptidase [Aurantibacter aestuarii]PSG89948.1 hypothetical protein C7H52_01370 [Aurantibacter aestuarii]
MDEIIHYKKKNKLSWNTLAECLPISGDSLRIAFKRNSVDQYYINTIKTHFEISNKIEQKKSSNTKEDNFKGIPSYTTDISNHIKTSFSDVLEIPEFYVNYKPFNDCTAYVNIYGDNMLPKYGNGDRLAIKQIFNLDVLIWGETYLVVTNGNANNLRTFKDVHPHKEFDKIILRATNPNYAGDIIINKTDILSMFIIKGKISHNFI